MIRQCPAWNWNYPTEEHGVLGRARIPLRSKKKIMTVLGNRVRCLGRGPMISGSGCDKRINDIPMLAAFPSHLTGVEW